MGLILSNKGEVSAQKEISSVRESTRGELSVAVSSSQKIKKSAIINLINHTHFTDGCIQVHIRNTLTGDELIVMAYPEPCVKEIVICKWIGNDSFNPADYVLLNLVINDGKALALVPAETISITDQIFIAALPERGYLWNRRQGVRYPCNDADIDVEIIQDYKRIEGTLKNFSAAGFCIRLDVDSFKSLHWLEISKSFFVQLRKEGIIYTGFCTYVKSEFHEEEHLVVLAPAEPEAIHIKRENRNPRLNLVPAPKIIFEHPFLNKTVQFEVADISASGFSVQVSVDESSLMPGLFIRSLCIEIAGGMRIKCYACIIYQLKIDENEIKYGFSVLDMGVNDYNQLFAVLCNAHDPHVNMSYNVDLDSLWDFFFKSGFIYPQKYEMLESNLGEIKETYKKLYQNGRDVSTNITYQNNGRIYGHCSLLRAYQRAWLVHHLAATSLGKSIRLVGIHVLNQVLNYVDTLFKLPSSKMDYLMFFYNPDNRFSDYFFGGFFKEVNNPRIISMDTFAYLSICPHLTQNTLADGMELKPLNSNDCEVLNNSYEKQSGGLFVKALALGKKYNEESFEELYNSLGLKRIFNVYALKENKELKAVIIADQSNIGINMSELLNCIKIIVVDLNLSWEKLDSAINTIGKMYTSSKVSVMIYPSSFLNLHGITYDKCYNLWIVDSKYGYEYNNYLKQRANPRLSSLLK